MPVVAEAEDEVEVVDVDVVAQHPVIVDKLPVLRCLRRLRSIMLKRLSMFLLRRRAVMCRCLRDVIG
jgi:hypothetical protein